MKYKLLGNIKEECSAIEQILINRGIPKEKIEHYLNTTDKDINDAEMLGEENLKAAAAALVSTINNSKNALVIVDCDCDGYTSSALLINYLYKVFPSWVENNIKFFLHDNKQHGLQDCMEYILSKDFSLVIVPDAGSSDIEQHKILKEHNITTIVLDHHEADTISEYAIVINNQLCDYPNKFMSGVGVTWQFCRYLDKLININYANDFLDLVALGMMRRYDEFTIIRNKTFNIKRF